MKLPCLALSCRSALVINIWKHLEFTVRKLPRAEAEFYLHSAARDEYVLLVYVKVDMGYGGQVGRAPFVKVSNELEGEVWQLVAVRG